MSEGLTNPAVPELVLDFAAEDRNPQLPPLAPPRKRGRTNGSPLFLSSTSSTSSSVSSCTRAAAVSAANAMRVTGEGSVHEVQREARNFTVLEALSGRRARRHFLLLYVAIALCTAISAIDYFYMWECANICGEVPCSSPSSACLHQSGHGNASLPANWTGSLQHLDVLNRFMHLTLTLNATLPELSVGGGTVLLRERVQTEQGTFTSNRTVDISHCRFERGCSSRPFRIAAAGRKRYSVEVEVLEADPEVLRHLPDMGLMLEYQIGLYTLIDIVVRYILLAVVVWSLFAFQKRINALGKTATQEQMWVPYLLVLLVVYLNPLALVSALADAEGSLIGVFLEFVEFHGATYFIAFIQTLYVVLVLDGCRPNGVAPRIGVAWLLLMCASDAVVASYVGPSSDYATTYVRWLWNTHLDALPRPLFGAYVAGFSLLSLWLISAVVVTKYARKTLRLMPYGPTRRQQLTFRSLVFTVWAFVLSRAVCIVFYWVVIGSLRPAYRSSDELGAVVLSAVFALAWAYQFAPAPPRDPDAPPHPGEPSWEAPRWRRCVWKREWYNWLRRHGGSLYYFILEAELDAFLTLQTTPVQVWRLSDAPSGWPVRSAPCLSSSEVKLVHEGFEVEVVAALDGWLQLIDGNWVQQDTHHKRWVRVARRDLEPSMDHHESLAAATLAAAKRGAAALLTDDADDEDEPAPRLFFCLETAARLLDLSYSVYYPLGNTDLINTLPTAFARRLACEYGSVALTSLAATIMMVCSGLAPAPAPFRTHSPPLSRSGNSRSGTPAATPRTPRGRDPHGNYTQQADLFLLGLRLIDVIELAGTQVFVACPFDGSPRIYVAFKGSDIRFTKMNLITDVRVTRRVWQTMGTIRRYGTPGCLGECCSAPLLHRGFMEMWEAPRGGHALRGPLQDLPLRDAVLGSVDAAIQYFGSGEAVKVYITGHSLGGAMACLLGYTLRRRRGINPIVYTFGMPKIGNAAFAKEYNADVPNTFRVVYEYDPVVHVAATCCNRHIGREICIDRRGNLLVEPMWVEKTFQPTKRVVLNVLGGHKMDAYALAINRAFLRAGCTKKCFHPRTESLPHLSLSRAGDGPSRRTSDVGQPLATGPASIPLSPSDEALQEELETFSDANSPTEASQLMCPITDRTSNFDEPGTAL